MSTESPGMLKKGNSSGFSGRFANKKPLVAAVLILMFALTIFFYAASTLEEENSVNQANQSQTQSTSAQAIDLFSNAPSFGAISGNREPIVLEDTIRTEPVLPQNTELPVLHNQGTGPQVRDPAWEQYQAEQQRLEMMRRNQLQNALSADTTINTGNNSRSNTAPPDPMAALMATANNAGNNPALNVAGLTATPDPNRQSDKAAWLNQPTGPQNPYLQATRVAALSPYELKAGTIIPGVMISGINSDLPGQLVAQVRENVYDTQTGQYLLIPQGSKLIGTYDNGVSIGQERVLVAWTRIIFPDTSSLDLGRMPGADMGGYAGFADQVNNHYLRIYGNALLLSMFSAGLQLSQPRAGVNSTYNNGQVIAGAVGSELGALGSEMARRNMDIAPTIEIRPGFRFNVMVTRDIILNPYQQ